MVSFQDPSTSSFAYALRQTPKTNGSTTKTKATAAKKPATSKASKASKIKVRKPVTKHAGNDSDDGNISDDEATPRADGRTNGNSTKAQKLAAAILGEKRKLEQMSDDELAHTAIKKECIEQEEHMASGSEKEMEYNEEGDPSNEQLWSELTYGMGI